MTKAKSKSKGRYTNDLIPIKSITNGMIILDNNYKVTGVKIVPQYLILDQDMQNSIIANL